MAERSDRFPKVDCPFVGAQMTQMGLCTLSFSNPSSRLALEKHAHMREASEERLGGE